jgi:hypothetical protein
MFMGCGVHPPAPCSTPARLDAATAETVADTPTALTAPSRWLNFGRLRESPASVKELAEAIEMEQSSVLIKFASGAQWVWSPGFPTTKCEHGT